MVTGREHPEEAMVEKEAATPPFILMKWGT
jgi:hypothetical protein